MSRHLRRSLIVLLALGASGVGATELAPGVTLIPGRFVSGAQPDGNTVVLRGRGGLVVIDTGRHAVHTEAILALAAREACPVAAVINTHWHLDHTGGNARIRRAFPGVRVWASGAIGQARKGFLANYRRQLLGALQEAQDPAARKSFEAEIAIIDSGPALEPDEEVRSAGTRVIAGLPLQLGLERHAVTAADVWVFDARTGILIAGDLVTLPAPLFDTACPQGWRAALDRLGQVEFSVLVPGHGPPLTRAEFVIYRAGFGHLLDCAASSMPVSGCVEGWVKDVAPLIGDRDSALARSLVEYYVANVLRAPAAQIAAVCGE